MAAKRVRVVRQIVYEGDADWIALVLSKSLVKPGMKFDTGRGTIHLESESVSVSIPEVPYGA